MFDPCEGPPQNAPTFCGDGQKQLDELHIALVGDVEEDYAVYIRVSAGHMGPALPDYSKL